MSVDWQAITWPEAALGQALVELASASNMEARPRCTPSAPHPELSREQLERWLIGNADHLGLELQPTECGYVDLLDVLRKLGPSLLRLDVGRQHRYLTVTASTRRELLVLGPELRRVAVPHEAVFAALTASLEHAATAPVASWLDSMQVPRRRARRAGRTLIDLALEERTIGGLYLVRPDPGSDFVSQLRERGLLCRAVATLALSCGHVGLALLGWLLLGRGALSGALEAGWIGAWVLALMTAFPLQLAIFWLGGGIVNEVSVLIKRRLLCGALRIDADQIQSAGSGRLLAMVFESQALESAGLAGAFGLTLSFVQLASAAAVIALGASGVSQLVILLSWCGLCGALARRYLQRRSVWTQERFRLARGFVENVVGNRTRIAQQPERRWHVLEDQQLDTHLAASTKMDDAQTQLTVLPARGWLLLGCAGLVPMFLGSGVDRIELAIAVGGILQAYGALAALTHTAISIGAARVAWTEVGPLFHAASRCAGQAGNPALGWAPHPHADRAQQSTPVLDVRGVRYRYSGRDEPILQGCDLSLFDGDRILLEGLSGAGKSTLAALMVGLREVDAGHILLSGLDRSTLGDASWRRRVASAPQFHENHVLSASLGFNLLMGRAWPASADDLREAEAVCNALGLGALIARMPSRMNQIVGETGWQLSHGEQSRLFLARALLQGADVVVLDESFGALDPHTLHRCMDAVLERARTLVVIAHP